jgi:hypothetical protein
VKGENERNMIADGYIRNCETVKASESNINQGDSSMKKVTAKKQSLSELEAMKIAVSPDGIYDSGQNFIRM